MSEVKISIIMPVYKVEDYVGKAIESMQAQTLTQWEFLIVDDGTPDKSGEICDEYAKKDSRIKVIHKENGGAPSARNVAIDIAKGKYMYFLDSDDWAENTMLEDMYNLAEQTSAQLVVAGFYIDTYYGDGEDEKYTQVQNVQSVVYPDRQAFRENSYKLFDKNLLYTPWNKLYSAEYILQNKLYFPQTFWDDFPFNLSIVRQVERVAVTQKCYYHFIRKRGESETAKYRSDMLQKREEEHAWLEELYSYWQIDSPQVREFLSRRYIERIIGCIENVTNKNCSLSKKEVKKQISQMINSPKVRAALENAVPNSKYMKLMLIPIKKRSVNLTYLEGRFISNVKTKHVKLFAKLKANR